MNRVDVVILTWNDGDLVAARGRVGASKRT